MTAVTPASFHRVANPNRTTGARARTGVKALRVSVVIVAFDTARNLVDIATRLPEGLHEVVYVHSPVLENTVESVKELWPDAIVIADDSTEARAAVAAGVERVTGEVTLVIDGDGYMDELGIPSYLSA